MNQTPTLQVSSDGRRLERPDGTPFFYLADTAWELLHRLDREDTEHYLTTRASQGYTVVQNGYLGRARRVAHSDAGRPSAVSLLGSAKPNEAYFAHVDYVVRRMNELGIVPALLPTWGDKVLNSPGEGPQIFTPENARAYGGFVGARYRDAQVIWIMGGDRDISRPPFSKRFAKWRSASKRATAGGI
jgi:hypothetical protein